MKVSLASAFAHSPVFGLKVLLRKLAFAFAVFLAPGVAPFVISNPMNMIVAEYAGLGFNAYAAKMVPGDLGTKGGVRTDVYGRALRDDDTVIDGLYAAGNVSSPVMGHTYPGPGGTIGPAMTFGYLAALHIAGKA